MCVASRAAWQDSRDATTMEFLQNRPRTGRGDIFVAFRIFPLKSVSEFTRVRRREIGSVQSAVSRT